MVDPPPLKLAEPAASAPVGTPTSFKVGIGSISDVVFGLALSIGSLSLVSRTPQTGYELAQGIYYFGFSFLIVVLVWLSFRRIVVVLPHETQATLTVNVALLFCVAIEPFLFFVMVAASSIGEDASTAFAIDIGVMMFLLSALDYLLLKEERSSSRHRLPQEVVDRQGRSILLHMADGSVFLVSAFPLFWSVTIAGSAIRYDLWYFALIWVLAIQARSAAVLRPNSTTGIPDPSAPFSRAGPAEAR